MPGRLHSTGDGEELKVIHFREHNHMPDEEKVTSIRVKAKLCDLARAEPLKSLQQLYCDLTTGEDMPEEAAEILIPDFTGCRTQMYNARRKKFPQLPTTREAVSLQGEWIQTSRGDNFLLHSDSTKLIFTTQTNLKILTNSTTLLMDGTSKVVQRIYSRLFTIHRLYRGFYIPLVYCLLPDKRRETYHEVFDTLRRKMAETNLVLNPTKLMLDFESGLLPALRTQFPNATIKGCYFHHIKAIWSHVQDLG